MSKKIRFVFVAFSIVFVLFGVFVYGMKLDDINYTNNQYYALMENVLDFNDRVVNESSSNVMVDLSTNEQSIFQSAKEAILYAFNDFYNLSQYEFECTSVATINAMRNTIIMDAYNKIIKYPDDTYLLYSVRYQRPHPIDTVYNLGLTSGDIYYFNSGYRFGMRTTEIVKDYVTLTPTWSGDRLFKTGAPITANSYFYIINNVSIINEISFQASINPITKKLTNYYVSVGLNASYATKDYRKIFILQTGNEDVYFNKLVLHCVLDSEGKLVSFRTEEEYAIQGNLFGIIPVTATISQINKFVLNRDLSIPLPTKLNDSVYIVDL